jgi:C1A family cysteine protease
MSRRHYGWKPDLPDHRDHYFKVVAPIQLPLFVDLRSKYPPAYDQGQIGDCTMNAIPAVIQFLEMMDNKPPMMPSRLFGYYGERDIEGTVDYDSGAQLRDGIQVVSNLGICSEITWPYDLSQFAVKPSNAAYTEALQHKVLSYARVDGIQDMKQCLAAGYPFVFGFTVYESFESDEVANTGMVPMPGKKERVCGGHAVASAGYDDSTNMMLVRNSWGTSWGLNGYFWMPYDYISNDDLATDFWTIRSGELM